MEKWIIELIKFKAEAILKREVMEADCLNFGELVDKMAEDIVKLCDTELRRK